MSHQADGRAGRMPAPPVPGGRPSRSSFAGDLRAVLGERDFRKLFAARLISQTGDGVFNAGLGAYVFFSAQSFPDPGAAAVAFAVLYLPYSLVGPFAGVFIDRWSRRQILVWSALARFAFVAVTAAFVATGTFGLPLYIGALLVLGVNRFFLSSLSAALPHVISSDKLVMANAVAPTSGTVVAFLGGIAGIGVHLITGGGRIGSAVTLMAGGICYAAAAWPPPGCRVTCWGRPARSRAPRPRPAWGPSWRSCCAASPPGRAMSRAAGPPPRPCWPRPAAGSCTASCS